jgi:hypothetical protein
VAVGFASGITVCMAFRGGVGKSAGMAQVGIAVGVAVGIITEFIYSILHGPKSCNIEYGQ